MFGIEIIFVCMNGGGRVERHHRWYVGPKWLCGLRPARRSYPLRREDEVLVSVLGCLVLVSMVAADTLKLRLGPDLCVGFGRLVLCCVLDMFLRAFWN